ncbi:MFS transporter [Rhodobacterales bacterium HKCCE2091]|nr:MFS transporter [Rhodobacterales bacterium HKCCE2091]
MTHAEDTGQIDRKPGPVPGFCAPGDRRFVLIAAILASALGFIDGTLVALALPVMREGLGASLAEAQWIQNGYLLPLSALILLGGALGDRFGLARVFSLGIGVFVAASLLCAAAPTPGILIAARVVQGIGAAMMVPGSLALIARAYPREERGRAIGIWAAASALTTAIGPILAGLALSFGGPGIWRFLFAINLPFGAIALWLVVTRVARDPARPDRPLDLPGAALATAALGLLAAGLTEGGHATLAAIGIGLMAAFVAWEARAPAPMIPLSLFRDRGFAAANASTLLLYFALSAVMFYLPMLLVAGWREPEISASAAFAPLSVMIPALSARAGALATRHGPGPLIGVGGLLVAAGFTALALVVPSHEMWTRVLPATTLMGVGMGLVVAPLSTAIMAAVPEDRSGTASGINNAVARMAGMIAVAVLGTLAAAVYGAAGGTGSYGAFSDAAGHVAAMDRAFQAVALSAGAAAAFGAILALVFIPRQRS